MSLINISIDMSPIVGMSEYLTTLATGLDSQMTRANLSKAMGEVSAAAFNSYADAKALANPLALWHVYENGMVGDPRGRLWALYLTGSPTQKLLEFDWRAAHKVNAVGEKAQNPVEGDTRRSVHVFVWKAPIMEHGATVHVGPGPGKTAIAFPGDDGAMHFSRSELTFETAAENQGAFESIWETFWREGIDTLIEQDFVTGTEKAIGAMIPRAMFQLQAGMGKLSFGVNLKPKRNMVAVAQKDVAAINSGYIRAARQREAISGTPSGV